MKSHLFAVPFAIVVLSIAGCNLSRPASAPSPETAPTLPAPEIAATTQAPPPAPTQTPAPPNVQDLIDRCPSPQEIASVDADIRLSFEYDPTAGTLVCRAADGSTDLTRLQLRAYQVLLVMQRLQFDQPLPWTDKTLYAWFTSSIKGIRFRNDIQYSSCCNPANTVNLVTSLEALETDRWLQAERTDVSIQSLMLLLIHEARHNNGYPHTCGTLDRTISEMGAFGVQYWTYVWLAGHSDPAFMTSGGTQPDLYRSINRDLAVQFLKPRQQGAGPFCQEATTTPGPTPTIP